MMPTVSSSKCFYSPIRRRRRSSLPTAARLPPSWSSYTVRKEGGQRTKTACFTTTKHALGRAVSASRIIMPDMPHFKFSGPILGVRFTHGIFLAEFEIRVVPSGPL